MFSSLRGETSPTDYDVTVLYPMHPSSSSAEDTPGTAATRKEAMKRSSDAGKACEQHGWRLVPGAVETTGSWGLSARRCARDIVRRQAMRSGEEMAAVASRVWRRLCSSVAKGMAQMLLRVHGAALSGEIADHERLDGPAAV